MPVSTTLLAAGCTRNRALQPAQFAPTPRIIPVGLFYAPGETIGLPYCRDYDFPLTRKETTMMGAKPLSDRNISALLAELEQLTAKLPILLYEERHHS